MVLFEAALVIGLVWLVVYGTIRLRGHPQQPQRPALPAGQWRPAHYDTDGNTCVVLQKVSGSGHVLDEHLVARIPLDDPDYDTAFLSAMDTARQRRALFEAEEE
jgi:hypothetical protein